MSISEHLDGSYLDFESIWDGKGRLVLPVSDPYVFFLFGFIALAHYTMTPMRPSIAGLFWFVANSSGLLVWRPVVLGRYYTMLKDLWISLQVFRDRIQFEAFV